MIRNASVFHGESAESFADMLHNDNAV